MRADGQIDMTNLIVALRSFVTAPKHFWNRDVIFRRASQAAFNLFSDYRNEFSTPGRMFAFYL